jgi:hypothetical protein
LGQQDPAWGQQQQVLDVAVHTGPCVGTAATSFGG